MLTLRLPPCSTITWTNQQEQWRVRSAPHERGVGGHSGNRACAPRAVRASSLWSTRLGRSRSSKSTRCCVCARVCGGGVPAHRLGGPPECAGPPVRRHRTGVDSMSFRVGAAPRGCLDRCACGRCLCEVACPEQAAAVSAGVAALCHGERPCHTLLSSCGAHAWSCDGAVWRCYGGFAGRTSQSRLCRAAMPGHLTGRDAARYN